MSKKEYTCVCGALFDNPQKFNGHKQGCPTHIISKYGSLDIYYEMKNRNHAKGVQKQKDRYVKKQEELLDKWISEQHKCEKCGKIMTEKFGPGRFCSRACANSRVWPKKTNQKILKAPVKSKPVEIRLCSECGKQLSSKNSSGLCSICVKHRPHTEESKHKQSLIMKSKGYPRWHIRRNEPSYAEKFFMQVLKNNNITYLFEYAVPNSNQHFYYLDFFIDKSGTKIDLEIDGAQHKYRKEHDIVRDRFLEEQGYRVYRIVWNNINTDSGKACMKEKIDEFISFYNSL